VFTRLEIRHLPFVKALSFRLYPFALSLSGITCFPILILFDQTKSLPSRLCTGESGFVWSLVIDPMGWPALWGYENRQQLLCQKRKKFKVSKE